jgi:hypothetical protein
LPSNYKSEDSWKPSPINTNDKSLVWKRFPFHGGPFHFVVKWIFNGVKAHSTSQGPLENKGEKMKSL